MQSFKIAFIIFINWANILVNSNSLPENDCFRAAVYEHVYLGNIKTDVPINIITSNLNVFDQIASKASNLGANILLFPEDGIIDTTLESSPEIRLKVSEGSEQIPDPFNGTIHNPCAEAEKYKSRPILYRLSCMAIKNNIYIVADMGDFVKCNNATDHNCPIDGHYLFNTAVAFDPKGNLVAKYHKMQVYYEPMYNIPTKPQLIHFDTPFGRMGLHICFDILFNLPGTKLVSDYNVTTMLFPTWWYDELPFVFSTQMQQSWAIANRVNLLAANTHFPETGSLGSGIYSGENGAIVYSDIPDGKSKLLIADIPIDSRNTKAKCLSTPFKKTIPIESTLKVSTEYKAMDMSLDGFALLKLSNQSDSFNVCDNGFCCQLNYSVESKQTLEQESYWFMIANRTGYGLNQKHYPICEEICGIARCDSGSYSTCHTFAIKTNKTIFKSINISAKFSTKYSYPSVTTNDLQLVPIDKWNYKNDRRIGSQVRLDFNGYNEPIIAAGLYGRCYDRDPPYKQ